jgi:folate-binding protein YgfZ
MPNVLLDLHKQAAAETQAYGDIEIVSTFGEPQAEYAAIRKSCGLMDLPFRGFLELTGKDRLPFLNNLLTNQTYDKQAKTGIAAGAGVYAFLLNAKSGRVMTDVNVLELGERTLLEMDRRMVEPVRALLDRYLFAEQVKLADRSDDLHEIALHGPGSLEVLRQAGAAGAALEELPPLRSAAVKLFDLDVVVWRDDPVGVPGYYLIIPAGGARRVWMELISRFGQSAEVGRRPLRPVGWAAFNATRIEGGRPLFGIDFDDSILPHETGPLLDRAVSFTKGCYPGQEIVARMHARQQVARKIVGLRMAPPDADALPIAGTKVYDASGNEIGGITSSTPSPVLSNAAIGLGIVKRPHFNVGTTVRIPAEGAMRSATVVDLPFIAPPPPPQPPQAQG